MYKLSRKVWFWDRVFVVWTLDNKGYFNIYFIYKIKEIFCNWRKWGVPAGSKKSYLCRPSGQPYSVGCIPQFNRSVLFSFWHKGMNCPSCMNWFSAENHELAMPWIAIFDCMNVLAPPTYFNRCRRQHINYQLYTVNYQLVILCIVHYVFRYFLPYFYKITTLQGDFPIV